jgi:hypothetical protein
LIPNSQVAVELGGRSDLHPVPDRVYGLVKDRLNEHDLAALTDGITPRWRNTAQWARNTLREEGPLRRSSHERIPTLAASFRSSLLFHRHLQRLRGGGERRGGSH